MVAKEGCDDRTATPTCSTPASVGEAVGSNDWRSGQLSATHRSRPVQSTDMPAGGAAADTAGRHGSSTACLTTCSCIQGVGGSTAAGRAGQCCSKCAQASCLDDWQCHADVAARAGRDCQSQIKHCTLISARPKARWYWLQMPASLNSNDKVVDGEVCSTPNRLVVSEPMSIAHCRPGHSSHARPGPHC